MSTWIFQGNPKKFDLDSYLVPDREVLWSVNQKHLAAEMRPGDQVFFWRSKGGAGRAGIIAQGTIIEAPRERAEDEASLEFWREAGNEGARLRVAIRVNHGSGQQPVIDAESLAIDPKTASLRILRMRSETNYRLRDEEAERLAELWDGRNEGSDRSEFAFFTLEQIYDALAATDLVPRCVAFASESRFLPMEFDYKLNIAATIRSGRDRVLEDGDQTFADLLRAFGRKGENILNWRTKATFEDWCRRVPAVAYEALRQLWRGDSPIAQRIDSFADSLSVGGIQQRGQQLCLTSLLLMADDPVIFPPVRARLMSWTFKAIGLRTPRTGSVARLHATFMSVLDAIIDRSSSSSRPILNRLEAQGALWCCFYYKRDPQPDIELFLSAAESATPIDDQGPTVRSAIIESRVGQQRYRDRLIGIWLGCSVTGCRATGVLRASHLKPWKDSSDEERLDGFNGLLLTPNLDTTLDSSLIAFEDDGMILLSSELSPTDARALGIDSTLRLRFVRPEHLPYLRHRRAMFRARLQKNGAKEWRDSSLVR